MSLGLALWLQRPATTRRGAAGGGSCEMILTILAEHQQPSSFLSRQKQSLGAELAAGMQPLARVFPLSRIAELWRKLIEKNNQNNLDRHKNRSPVIIETIQDIIPHKYAYQTFERIASQYVTLLLENNWQPRKHCRRCAMRMHYAQCLCTSMQGRTWI